MQEEENKEEDFFSLEIAETFRRRVGEVREVRGLAEKLIPYTSQRYNSGFQCLRKSLICAPTPVVKYNYNRGIQNKEKAYNEQTHRSQDKQGIA